jgi:superfamily II DNA or RNA helicase
MSFSTKAKIEGNERLRVPQLEGWKSIREHFNAAHKEREVGIVLPVGCGKSGLIALTPFAVGAKRVLVLAPGLRIRDQLAADLKASSETNFYERLSVLEANHEFPQTAVAESGRVNVHDVRGSDFTVANIDQVAGIENRLLDQLEPDFFDLILVDEAHHNVAASWQQVKGRFPNARIVNGSSEFQVAG